MSEVVKAFAAATGRGRRSAQMHAKANSNEWLEFCKAQAAQRNTPPVVSFAGTGNQAPPSSPSSSPANSDRVPPPPAARTRAEEMELSAYYSWKVCAAEKLKGARINDPNLVSLARAEIECLKSYHLAKSAREKDEIASRSVYPASVIEEIRRKYITTLGSLLQNMPREVGPKILPFDPAYAVEVLEDWLIQRINPALQFSLEGLARYESPISTIPQETEN